MSTSDCRGKKYDGALQQCVEEAREPKLAHLLFQRWLVENGYYVEDVGAADSQ